MGRICGPVFRLSGDSRGVPLIDDAFNMTVAVAYPARWHAAVLELRADPKRNAVEARRLLGRLHEALMGRPTFALAERLAASERWRPERLAELQSAKLRRLVEHAARHCPFYRDRGLPSGGSSITLDDLAAVNLLTRDDLRRRGRRMCWQHMPGKRLADFTRGTTEERLAYFWDRRRQAWDKANRLRGHAWHGFTPDDRELHVWPVDPPRTPQAALRQWLRAGRDHLLGELQIDSLHAFKDRLALTWRAWRRFDPSRVTAYPSVLAQLIRDGRRAGCRLGNPALRKVFLTGEVTFPWQRRLIETELGVPTVQMYGVQEAGALSFACEFESWHVAAESAIIEIIRDGRAASPGELGEVVVTGLESRAMPLIRYCTGDVVRVPGRVSPGGGLSSVQGLPTSGGGGGHSQLSLIGSGPCPCGRGLPVMPKVVGRAGDFLENSDGRWVEPAVVVASLGEVLQDGTFQVRQDACGDVQVLVVPTSGQRHGWSAAARDRVRELAGPAFRCLTREVSILHRSLFGKCRYVSSERTRRGLAWPAGPTM